MTEKAHPRKVRSQIYTKLRSVASDACSEGSGVRSEPFDNENSLPRGKKQLFSTQESGSIESRASDHGKEENKESPKLSIRSTSQKLVDYGVDCYFTSCHRTFVHLFHLQLCYDILYSLDHLPSLPFMRYPNIHNHVIIKMLL